MFFYFSELLLFDSKYNQNNQHELSYLGVESCKRKLWMYEKIDSCEPKNIFWKKS
jgi:hypothetical protein